MKKKIPALLAAATVLLCGATACDLDSSSASGSGHHRHHHAGGTHARTTANTTRSDGDATPDYSVGQENAIRAARQYLQMGTGFSRSGLIEQLASQAGSGFPMAEAVFAVNHVRVDWNQQALIAAKAYLKLEAFSRSGLMAQLTSGAGSQFTLAQATYAANQLHL